MTRLTNTTRQEVMREIISASFDDKYTAAIKRYVKLSNAALDAFYDLSVQRKMKRLPEGWLPTAQELKFHLEGERHSLHFSDHVQAWISQYGINISTELNSGDNTKVGGLRRVLDKHRGTVGIIRKTDPYAPAFFAAAKAEEAVAQVRNDAKEAAVGTMRLLKGFTTVEAAITAWPSAKVELTKHLAANVKKSGAEGKAVLASVETLDRKLGR